MYTHVLTGQKVHSSVLWREELSCDGDHLVGLGRHLLQYLRGEVLGGWRRQTAICREWNKGEVEQMNTDRERERCIPQTELHIWTCRPSRL